MVCSRRRAKHSVISPSAVCLGSNDAKAIERVRNAAEKLHLPVVELTEPLRASEDFGYYTKECPGAMFYLGNGEDYPALHTPEYDFRDELLELAVNIFKKLI